MISLRGVPKVDECLRTTKTGTSSSMLLKVSRALPINSVFSRLCTGGVSAVRPYHTATVAKTNLFLSESSRIEAFTGRYLSHVAGFQGSDVCPAPGYRTNRTGFSSG